MKVWFLVLGCFFCGVFPAFGLEGRALLAAIDRQVSFETDFSAEYTVTQDRPGEPKSVQTLALFRRDKASKFTILILSPEIDKGKGYLKVDNNLWFYDPVGRRFTVTSAKDRFQNSNARNSDFTRSNLAGDYRIVGQSKVALGKFQTTVLELEATNDGVSFPRSKIWITDDLLVRKTEDSSLSGQLMRTVAVPQYQKVGDRWVPVSMVIVDNLKGKAVNGKMRYETTTIAIAKPNLDPVADLVFTQGYLEKVSR